MLKMLNANKLKAIADKVHENEIDERISAYVFDLLETARMRAYCGKYNAESGPMFKQEYADRLAEIMQKEYGFRTDRVSDWSCGPEGSHKVTVYWDGVQE